LFFIGRIEILSLCVVVICRLQKTLSTSILSNIL